MKQVLFVSHSGGLAGAETVLFEELRIMHKICDIHLLLPCDSELFYKKIINEKLHIKSITRYKYRLYGNGVFKVILKGFYNMYPLLKILFLIRKKNIEIIYSNSVVNLIGIIAAIISGRKHIFHLHELPNKQEIYIGIRLDFILRRLMQSKYNTNIFISKKMKNYWEKRLSLDNKGIIVYNLIKKIDELKIQKNICSNSVSFGFAGTFYERKNIIFLLESFFQFNMGNKNSVLLLAGKGPQMTEIKSLVSKMCLEDSVEFMGSVEDIESFLNYIDVLILPSLAEAMPLIVFEAIKAKKLCLVTSQTSLGELLNDKKHCFYFNPNNKDELVALMNFVSKHRACTIKMIDDAYNVVDSIFNENRYLNNWLLIFKNELSI